MAARALAPRSAVIVRHLGHRSFAAHGDATLLSPRQSSSNRTVLLGRVRPPQAVGQHAQRSQSLTILESMPWLWLRRLAIA